jgi:hypothetical protein
MTINQPSIDHQSTINQPSIGHQSVTNRAARLIVDFRLKSTPIGQLIGDRLEKSGTNQVQIRYPIGS